VNSVDKVKVERCEHVIGHCSYVRNEPNLPPVLLVENLPEVNVVVLTNQVIRIYCPSCYAWSRTLSTKPVHD
jgi:hypothetical protein